MSTPPDKICASCGRRIEWRKKWERDWESVRFCGTACRRRGVTQVDARLEQAILDLLADRARSATICPSEAARAVGDVVITQGGTVVDPSTARGPIRIRRR